MSDQAKLAGIAVIQVLDKDGNVKDEETVENLITTIGDRYYAERGATTAAPTLSDVTGMKLGTGSTAATKSGAAAALGAYITGSNQVLDTDPPAVNAVGGDTGYTVDYVCTWAAGDVTNAAITEAVIVNDSATDATSAAANTIARITFTAKNKTASDSLVITWKHKFLGS